MLFCLLLPTFLLLSVQVGAFPLLARQSSQSITTVQTINSASGPVTQSCVTVLTPITDDQGNDAVQAVKTCTLLAANPSGTNSSTSTSPPSSSIEPSNAGSAVPTPTPLSSSLPSLAPTSPSSTPTSPSSTPTSVTESTAAAEQASATSAAFALPGKKLSVLPIGLGVFAGISAIALIVVGLVTYERTKYRKAFRQRKLAESGAAMGYGGNAA